ncbi:MAG TPA: C40 family peptidase, partial [Acidimicrobiia bacterium]|nr:C40 family peptidase [Acidimicrobiia bacterium]
VTQALRGELLEVEERREGWVRVVTGYAYPGWVREEHLTGDTPLDLARTYLGARYEWGGMSSAGIDCSGLVHMAYRRLGRLVPRDADQLEDAGTEVEAGELRRGDLVCYGDHIAFWLGDGRILHATGREGVRAVVEEEHPPELAARVRRYVRLMSGGPVPGSV